MQRSQINVTAGFTCFNVKYLHFHAFYSSRSWYLKTFRGMSCRVKRKRLSLCSLLQQMLSAEGVRAKLDAGGFSVRGKCEFTFNNASSSSEWDSFKLLNVFSSLWFSPEPQDSSPAADSDGRILHSRHCSGFTVVTCDLFRMHSQLVKPWGPTVENRGRQVKNYDELLGVKDKTKTRNEEVNTGKQMKQRRVRGSNEGMRCRWRHWELGGANEDDVKQVWEGKSDWGGAQEHRWGGSITTK